VDQQGGAWFEVPEQPGGDRPSALDRLRRHPAAAVAAASGFALAVALAGVLVAASAASPRIEIGVAHDPSDGAIGPDATTIVVDVAGGVRAPGLYRLGPGSRVGDAIAAAGGYGPTVDASAAARELNLAAQLSDGQKVVVPERTTATQAVTGGAAGSPGLVDLNRATQAELEALPGIGPVTAQKVIDARTERPFSRPDELLERKIVGRSTWEKIRDLVTVS
jgi:competence protein ComEA